MRTRFKIILPLVCLIAFISIDDRLAEAQTYNVVFITGIDAQPNPVFSGDSTTITINTFEYAQWFWLYPTTMSRPTIIVYVAGKPFIANMTSEQMGQISFWGYWFYWWFNQIGTWTHQVVWDGKDLQGNLVPPGPYLATVNVYAGGATMFGSVVINVEVPRKVVLSLNPAEVVPENNTVVTATVYDVNNNPVPNYAITLQAVAPQYQSDPCNDCGGHSHDTTRPIGNFLSDQGNPIGSTTQGTTDINGQFTITYEASQFGGVETIKAWGDQEPAVKDEKRLTVRVPGLMPLIEPSGSSFWYRLTGSTSAHSSNHYGTNSTNVAIYNIALDYWFDTDTTLGINDMSLVWGGLFDINGNWSSVSGHSLHRTGESVDIDRCAEGVLVDQDRLDEIALNHDGERIVEDALRPPPCAGPSDTPRIHYEF